MLKEGSDPNPHAKKRYLSIRWDRAVRVIEAESLVGAIKKTTAGADGMGGLQQVGIGETLVSGKILPDQDDFGEDLSCALDVRRVGDLFVVSIFVDRDMDPTETMFVVIGPIVDLSQIAAWAAWE